MRKTQAPFAGVFVAFSLLVSGCATRELWDKETFAKAHFPASPPDLRLFYSTERKDILVDYLDHRQDSAASTRRCYWLYWNLEHQEHPKFISSRAANGLVVVPVYQQQNQKPPKEVDSDRQDLYAVLLDDGVQFQLFSGERDLGTFQLPAWRDPSGRTTQIVLTPFAVAIDAVLIGAVIALVTSPYWRPVLIQNAYH